MSEEFFKELTAIIKKRRKELPKESYVSSLFKNGKVKIANKLGEEAVETISAYLNQGNKEILEESADLIFHLMILLEDSELTLYDVEKTLKKRMR
jgi:phosphoribosyl-ATP pyrophosphohydrolase/phosphoribosyl-AMP cyclohydrolase|tara:strand:+ start:2626 stop:2910 length:285 start_codon:yes stop_codon:yes gene_type:complete